MKPPKAGSDLTTLGRHHRRRNGAKQTLVDGYQAKFQTKRQSSARLWATWTAAKASPQRQTKAGSTESDAIVWRSKAGRGTPSGRLPFREIDNQANHGAFVGKTNGSRLGQGRYDRLDLFWTVPTTCRQMKKCRITAFRQNNPDPLPGGRLPWQALTPSLISRGAPWAFFIAQILTGLCQCGCDLHGCSGLSLIFWRHHGW